MITYILHEEQHHNKYPQIRIKSIKPLILPQYSIKTHKFEEHEELNTRIVTRYNNTFNNRCKTCRHYFISNIFNDPFCCKECENKFLTEERLLNAHV